MEIPKKLAKSLCDLQAEAGRVAKGGENKEQKFAYANMENFDDVVRPLLMKYGLSLTDSAIEITPCEPRAYKNGTPVYAVRVKLLTTVTNADGEFYAITVFGEGQDTGDKGVYKAITGARKYARACIFNLVTTDDPDARSEELSADATNGKQAKASAPDGKSTDFDF
jgi:hypothetical protein